MTIKELAKLNAEYVVATRRHLHKHPELSTKEYETTAFIKAELEKLGIEVQTFDDITGCIGTIRGAKPGKTVMLRADIDALPIQETNDKPYCSVNPGVMHACGHDGHAAMLLGAARILVEKKDEIQGTVKLIFQMAEEIGRQSENYVKKGCLEGVDAIFGMHAWNDVEAGKANVVYGERMACSDRFTIQIHGEPTHGSTPHLGHDAMVAAAAVVMNLQTLVSRVNSPLNPLVVTVGKMNGGQRLNILADHVELVGTTRAFNRELRSSLPAMIEKVVLNTVAVYDCTAECDYYFGPDPLINDHQDLVDIAQQVMKDQVGPDCLTDLEKMMGAEDFSVFMTEIPGVYAYLGSRNEAKGLTAKHHHPLFDIDEDVLHTGSGVYAQFAIDYLNAKAGE